MHIVFVCVVVNFLPAIGSRHMSHLIRNSWRQTTGYAKQSFSLRISPSCSQGHSFFWEINCPEELLLLRNQRPRWHLSFRQIHCLEDSSPSESVSSLRSIHPITSKTDATTDLINICLHSWSQLRHLVISHFKRCNNSYFSADCYRR